MESITIIGAGGIGCALGYALRVANWNVTFVDANESKVESGRRDGVEVVGRPALAATFVLFKEWYQQSDERILLCTKCYDNATVLERLTTNEVLPVQNGFDVLLDARSHPIEGIASFVSECERDRPRTRITRPGKLHLGYRHDGRSSFRDQLADTLRIAKLFPIVCVERIQPYKYTKLMYNAAVSPLAAAAGIDNGDLLALPTARRLFFALLQENYRILQHAGIELGKIGPMHPRTAMRILKQKWLARMMAFAFTPSLRGTYCSMAPDMPKGRTEIDYYNRHLIELAGDMPCPINRAVVELIDRMTRERETPRVGVLEELSLRASVEA